MRIIFAGTPDFAAVTLKEIVNSEHQVCAVYTQPDRPAGRGRRLRPSPVKRLALDRALHVVQPASLKSDEVVDQLGSHDADIMVVVAYGLILPQDVLATPRLGCINLHASLLPRWRGAAPIQRAILAGDAETGVTIIQMDEGLDTGDMLVREPCPIGADETGATLHDKLAQLGAAAVLTALRLLASGNAQAEAQDNDGACYAAKIAKEEAWIDWSAPSRAIELKVRAFNSWPVARTELEGRPLHVWQAKAMPGDGADRPGTVVAVNDRGIDVAAGEGVVRLLEVQLPGGRAMPVAELLKSRAVNTGTALSSPLSSVENSTA